MPNKHVTLFGEVLFDHFPEGQRVLGGAPFNVAWHLQALGQTPHFISRIGRDAEGLQIKQAMQQWGMTIENLQIDPTYTTGSVQVITVNGEPEYAILANQAYDFIDSNSLKCEHFLGNVLYHGSLALRQPVSAAALQTVMDNHTGKVFVDVNLRSPWWQAESVKTLLKRADWAKLNQEELMHLQPVQLPLKQAMQLFCTHYHLDTLIVTCGERGAAAINNQGDFFEVTPEHITVIDTVGAGDAFAAVALLGLQHNWSLLVILQRAQQLASAIVGRQGATVQDLSFYQAYTQTWQHD